MKQMTRNRKLKLNTITSLMNEAITFIASFLIPQMIIRVYGSATNGLVSSITSFLSIISVCEMGIGAVIRANLYKPLADKDYKTVSKVYVSSQRFFKIIAYILIAYVGILVFIFPRFSNTGYDNSFVVELILILSASTLAQYYFGINDQLLLHADQQVYITMIANAITTIACTIPSIILISNNVDIRIVKLICAVFLVVKPVVIHSIVKKSYPIERGVVYTEEPIKQKWNGFAQHIATIVQERTDIIILSLCSTLQSVSIYSVYFMITSGVTAVIYTMKNSLISYLGNVCATESIEGIRKSFDLLEWVMHTVTTILFVATGILIIPFVSLYTMGITDANYKQPLFAVLITIAQGLRCIQLIYEMLVHAKGHFKQTQKFVIVEPIINIVVSLVLISRFGLVGIAIGTICSMAYKVVYLVIYDNKMILKSSYRQCLKNIIIDGVSIILMLLATRFIKVEIENYWDWTFYAVITLLICFISSMLVNMSVNRKMLTSVYKHMFARKDKEE